MHYAAKSEQRKKNQSESDDKVSFIFKLPFTSGLNYAF